MSDAQMRTWAEIDLGRLKHNYTALREQLAPGCRFVGVVKANAYGHGAVPCLLYTSPSPRDTR